jgi:hypothetical protein
LHLENLDVAGQRTTLEGEYLAFSCVPLATCQFQS